MLSTYISKTARAKIFGDYLTVVKSWRSEQAFAVRCNRRIALFRAKRSSLIDSPSPHFQNFSLIPKTKKECTASSVTPSPLLGFSLHLLSTIPNFFEALKRSRRKTKRAQHSLSFPFLFVLPLVEKKGKQLEKCVPCR